MDLRARGFDPDKYIESQSQYIMERASRYDKLYLEFGGKLMYDRHAARCLPGYRENAKMELLKSLRDKAEIVISVARPISRPIRSGRIS